MTTRVGVGSTATVAVPARPDPVPVPEGPLRRRRVPDLLGLGWVVVSGIVAMTPALLRGVYLGPYDLLSRHGLTAQPGVVPRNPTASDQIGQMIPWNALAWTEVHAGHLPLWNPFAAWGTPLAFNWQSAPFGLPALVGYLVPERLSYTVGVLVTLVVAGTGAYVLGRVLGLGVLGSALSGTGFSLAGSTFVWLGWPVASVLSWSGWLLAAVLLVVGGRRRPWSLALLAAVVAAAVYAGEPDTLITLVTTVAVFTIALLVFRWLGSAGRAFPFRAVRDLAVAGGVGLALAAPLLLPGLQLASRSVRNGGGGALGGQTGLGIRDFANVFFGTGHRGIPFLSLSSIGAIVVTLVAVGVCCRWRRPAVRALTVTLVVTGLVTFSEPVIRMANAFPGLHAVRWPRSLMFVVLCTSVLAGVGLDALVTGEAPRRVRRVLTIGFAVITIGLALAVVVWSGSTGEVPSAFSSPFTNGFHARNVVWSLVGLVVGIAGTTILVVAARRRRAVPGAARPRRGRWTVEFRVGVLFLLAETVVLVALAAPFWASSTVGFPRPPAVRVLSHTVGSSLVGLGVANEFCLGQPGLGLYPNTYSSYDVHELAVYDPMLPASIFTSWQRATGQPGGFTGFSSFCPVVTSAVTARQFGIPYVLEAHGARGPGGAVFVRTVGDEALYRIPGASAATLTDLTPDGRLPAATAPGVPVAVTYPSPSSWRVTTTASTAQVLRLHLTDVPGWHATLDGHPLALVPYSGVQLQARVPPGRHTIVLTYWPDAFSVGLVVALIGLVALAVWVAVVLRGRRTGRSGREPPSTTPA